MKRLLPLALLCALFASQALADTIVLKSGERIEGRVVKETDTDLTLEVKVSANISDERIVPKAAVEKIDKPSPELAAYQAIMKIQTGANSWGAEEYEPLIRALQVYVARFPDGSHLADVQATLKELQAERKRVEGGEIKLRGVWMTRAQVEKERVQLGGQIALEQMKAQNVAGDGIGALNTFVAIEKTYPGSASYPEAVELAQKIIATLKQKVENAIPIQKMLKAETEQGFAAAGPADRADMKAAYKKDQDAAEAAVLAAGAGTRWPPFIQSSDKSLLALQVQITKETPRLAKLPVENMKRSIQLTTVAQRKLLSGEPEPASEMLKEAIKLWPTNELALRLEKDALARAKTEAARAVVPPEPAPAPATPKPSAPKSKKPSASQADPALRAQPVAEREAERPFFRTLPGAMTIVVGTATVLAGANIFHKIRARNQSVA